MESLTRILRENCMKATPQRIAIYEVLSKTKEHPSAEMIFKRLSDEYPTMSLATVYKSLDVFKKSGLIQELNVGEYSFRYDSNVVSHPHIICTICNKVEDISENIFADLSTKISNYTNYEVEKQQLYFYGKCPDCKNS